TAEQQAKKLADHYAGDITARTGYYHSPPLLETGQNHMFVSPKQLKAILRRCFRTPRSDLYFFTWSGGAPAPPKWTCVFIT
ncbi:hypothetical protein, partial [Klebsiella pneumoniae]|uniref:hypothetical protein n=1 Tax=Klebsiella pneumoniae TaxID=573 RepID=UPI0040557F18